MTIYRYRFSHGIFFIKPQPSGRWGLWLNECLLGSYHSAAAAADDVYMQATGFYDWDSLRNETPPGDLTDWDTIVAIP